MSPTGLAWIRRRQRTLTRAVLAVFCLAWLQVAVMPCANALTGAGGAAPAAATHAMSMPDMAPGEHCPYCPPAPSASDAHHGDCAFPHDPQIEARGLAFTMLLTAPVASFTLPTPDVEATTLPVPESHAPPWRTPLSVQYCRFLK